MMMAEANTFTLHPISVPLKLPNTSIIDSLPEEAKFNPSIRSGQWSDIGPRSRNEDESIRIDDLPTAACCFKSSATQPTALYAVFDGHGGCDASSYLKNHVMELFLGSDATDYNEFLKLLASDDHHKQESMKGFHRDMFLRADEALLAEESRVDEYCGTTALTALVAGTHLIVANAGDSRAVLCRNGGVSVQLTQDHRPNCIEELERIKNCGGYVEDGYLNGEIAVSRALGDRYMKTSTTSPLISEPDVFDVVLKEEDEFLIMACDGLWDVMSNEEAVRLVRGELERHGSPELSAKAIVKRALDRDTADNVTAVVVCFKGSANIRSGQDASEGRESPDHRQQRQRFRFCGISEEARDKLRSLLEGN